MLPPVEVGAGREDSGIEPVGVTEAVPEEAPLVQPAAVGCTHNVSEYPINVLVFLGIGSSLPVATLALIMERR